MGLGAAGNRETGRVVTVAFDDTEENLRASVASVAGWRGELIAKVAGTVVAVNDLESMACRGSRLT